MLPADTIAEITTNLAALQLSPNTAAQILAAVFAPLLRSGDPVPGGLPAAGKLSPKRRAAPHRRSRRSRRKRKYRRHAPTEAHDRALAALRANPDATTSKLAKLAKVSRSTIVNVRRDLAKEARKQARRQARKSRETTGAKTERRERAQQFLREQLAHGAKQASVVEEAAAKAHVDPTALEKARSDLGIVTSRGNAGGVMAVQWSLPAP
jgi:primosomal protein N'